MHPFRLLLVTLPVAMLIACSPAAPDAGASAHEAATVQGDAGMATFPVNLQAAGVVCAHHNSGQTVIKI